MLRLSYAPGKNISLFSEAYQVISADIDNQITLRDLNGVHHVKSFKFLLEQYTQGNVRALPLTLSSRIPERRITYKPIYPDISKAAKQRAYYAFTYATRLEEQGIPKNPNSIIWQSAVSEITKDLGLKSDPHPRTILRWLRRRQRLDNDISAFAPNFSARGGRGKPRFDPEVVSLMDKAIDELYLSSACETMAVVHQDLSQTIVDRNSYLPDSRKLRVPSYNSFVRHVRRRDQYEIFASRYGRQAAEKKFRQSKLAAEVGRILERVEIDHTPLDLFVVDSATGLPLGRPRLTIALDKASRAILGFDIGFTGNSAQAVLNCLKHAMLPKLYVKEMYPEIQSDWPMFGCPAYSAVDNGKEFHSNAVREALLELGISIFYCPTYSPQWKGAVERFLKTISVDFLGSLPGASLGHFYLRKGEKHPRDLAVIDMDQLLRLIHIWIVDVYHNKQHRGIHSTPYRAWSDRRGFVDIELPNSPEDLDRICSDITTRSIFHYGIELHGVRAFNSDQLQEIRRAFEHEGAVTVRVRWNDEKLDRCWIEDPRTNAWFELPNHDPHTRDLSRLQISLIRQMQRRSATKDEALTVVAARRILRDLAQNLMQSKRLRDRKRALDILGVGDGDTSNSPLLIDDCVPQNKPPKPKKPGKTRPSKQHAKLNVFQPLVVGVTIRPDTPPPTYPTL